MSWRANLRPGSFRGAAYRFREAGGEGGRRGELHEYPERDQPWFEDLGRAGRRWRIEAIVGGDGRDYMPARDALIEALEAKGAGTLIHPTRGAITAVCTSFEYGESTAEGGIATFSIEFVEAGAPIAAEARADTARLAAAQAASVSAAAPSRFASRFGVGGTLAFVENAGATLVRRLADTAAVVGTFLGGSGPALRAFEAGLSTLPSGALALVRAPLALGQAVVGLMAAIGGLGDRPMARTIALRRIMDDQARTPPVVGLTPARRRQRDNQAAFQVLGSVAAGVEIVRATAAIRFASYDEAIAHRDAVADQLDIATHAAADAGDDASADALDQLRLAMVRDVTARGGSLARLYGYTPAVTEPALVTAHRLYGNPDAVVADAEEIVGRNLIRHPGFVAGGQRLEVRTNV